MRSAGRACCALCSSEGDRGRDRPRARLPPLDPAPARPTDPTRCLARVASPVAAMVPPLRLVPRAGRAAAMPAALAPPCARGRHPSYAPLGPPGAVLCAPLRACRTRRRLVLRACGHSRRRRSSARASFASSAPLVLHLPARHALNEPQRLLPRSRRWDVL